MLAPLFRKAAYQRMNRSARMGRNSRRRQRTVLGFFRLEDRITPDAAAQTLPFAQNWSNIGLITTGDDWSGVPGVIGYRGDGLAATMAVDPQTVLAADDPGVVDVNANQANPNTFTTGGVAEFHITDPVVALQGSGTARAPYLKFHLNTTGFVNVRLSANLRDVDGAADNAVQPIAVHYRIGSSGAWTNLPAGFVADASTGPSLATLVTPIIVGLPAAANNQPLVQIRIMTTDAVGSDEWIGIDDVSVTGTSPATYAGMEVEPNNTPATATPLGGTNVKITGNVFPNADADFYSFTANAGDRVYAATMTSFSASGSTDSHLTILSSDGSTVLEFDDDDGTFGTLASTVAGVLIPSTGTYYAKINHDSATGQLRSYDLWLRVQSGAPVPETEPNDSVPQLLPDSGTVSGSTSSTTDVDLYRIELNAGDTVFMSLDLDPERDTVEWNAQLGIAPFGTPASNLVVNDGGTGTPDSEAHFMTVKNSGSYAIVVGLPAGGTTFGTYRLNVSVLPASTKPSTTYASPNVPVAIPTVTGIVTSTLTIPDNVRIGQLRVAINLTHANMPDLDIELTAPDGNTVGLLSDIGAAAQPNMDLILDDNAGIPVGSYTVVQGLVLIPEFAYRLDWFKGQQAQGTWTLTIRDDTTANGGTLNGWSLIIVDEDPLPATPNTLESWDFESNDGGFTHSGTADEWEYGTPSFAPITTANSGTKAWKTDLDNTYNASSTQDLFSPNIDLTAVTPGSNVLFQWAMKYQIESATFDHAYVEVQEVGGPMTRKVFEWLGATMTNGVGSPIVTVQEAAGWGLHKALINDFIGKTIRLRFHLDTDTSVQLGGLAIDDVSVLTDWVAPPSGTLTAQIMGNDLVVIDADGAKNNNITVSQSGSNIIITDAVEAFVAAPMGGSLSNGNRTLTIPISNFSGRLILNGMGGNDTVNVNYAAALGRDIEFDGGADGDLLTLGGGGPFTQVTHNLLGSSSGNVAVTGNGTVHYTGLEPITDALAAINRTFAFAGGSETVTLTDASGANMLIDSPLSEAVTFANPSGMLTIDAGTGNDFVTITSIDGAFAGSLTINGGTGDDTVNLDADHTFAAGASLNVDLQNDDPTPGMDAVTIGPNANWILSGSGTATIRASHKVLASPGSSIVTAGGAILLEANQQTVSSAGNFVGVDINGAVISSTGGNVTLNGRGGNAGGGNVGVRVHNAGSVSGGSAGFAAGVTGAGGVGGSYGVLVTGSNSRITAAGGTVDVMATTGGVRIETSGAVQSTANAAVNLLSNLMEFDGTAIVSAGAGTATLRPIGNSFATNLGGADSGAQLGLTDAELNRVTAGTIAIGDTAAYAGAVTVSAAIAVAPNLSFRWAAAASSALNVNDTLTVTGNVTTTGLDAANVNANITAASIAGDAAHVLVDDNPSGQIQDGIGLAANGGTVRVATGSYAENVSTAGKAIALSPGSSAGQVALVGDLTLDAADTLVVEINGSNPGDIDRIDVQGAVTLGGAQLAASLGFTPGNDDEITIIDNDGGDAVNGIFAGLDEGDTVLIGGILFNVSYTGPAGAGNDVTLTPNLAFTAVTNVRIGDDAPGRSQRSRIEQLEVSFSRRIDLANPGTIVGDGLKLTRLDNSTPVTVTVTWTVNNNGTPMDPNDDYSIATIRFGSQPNVFARSLIDGNYRLTIDGSKLLDINGTAVDADANSTPGGSQDVKFYRLFGDFQTTGEYTMPSSFLSWRVVDSIDFSWFVAAYGSLFGTPEFDPAFDYDGDDDVDNFDLNFMKLQFGKELLEI